MFINLNKQNITIRKVIILNKIILVFIIQYLFGQTAIASSKCLVSDASQLPKCEPNNRLASKIAPAQIVYLPLYLEDVDKERLLAGLVGTPTKLQLDSKDSLTPEQLEKYKNVIYIPAKRDLKLNGGSTGYGRDGVIYSFDPKSKRVVANGTNFELEYIKGMKICGSDIIQNEINLPDADRNSIRGGNILALPGGHCLTSKVAPKQFTDLVCGPKAKVVQIDTRFGRVNHVDEFFNVIPNTNSSCGFSVVAASPKRGLDNLIKNSKDLFFSKKGLEGIMSRSGQTCKGAFQCEKILDSCRSLELVFKLRNLQSELMKVSPSKKNINDGVSWLMNIFNLESAHAAVFRVDPKLEKEIIDWDLATYPHLHQYSKVKSPECTQSKNQDMIDILNSTTTFSSLQKWIDENESEYQSKFKALRCGERDREPSCSYLNKSSLAVIRHDLNLLLSIEQKNKEAQSLQEENWKKISDALPVNCRGEDIRVDMPAIMYGSGSLNPNPSNLQVVGRSVVVPLQFNESFEKDVLQQIEKGSHLSTVFANTNHFHEGGGNVHCMSNEVRICKP